MNIASEFGAGVARIVMPLLKTRLDEIQKDATAQLAEFLDEARGDLKTFLDEARKDIPEIGGAVATAAVQAVLDNTQLDEAANDVIGTVGGILGRLGIRR